MNTQTPKARKPRQSKGAAALQSTTTSNQINQTPPVEPSSQVRQMKQTKKASVLRSPVLKLPAAKPVPVNPPVVKDEKKVNDYVLRMVIFKNQFC